MFLFSIYICLSTLFLFFLLLKSNCDEQVSKKLFAFMFIFCLFFFLQSETYQSGVFIFECVRPLLLSRDPCENSILVLFLLVRPTVCNVLENEKDDVSVNESAPFFIESFVSTVSFSFLSLSLCALCVCFYFVSFFSYPARQSYTQVSLFFPPFFCRCFYSQNHNNNLVPLIIFTQQQPTFACIKERKKKSLTKEESIIDKWRMSLK